MPGRVQPSDPPTRRRRRRQRLDAQHRLEVAGEAPASTWWAVRATATRRCELCERERPDAMTLDLTMPALDGLGVLRALRERPGGRNPGGRRVGVLGRPRRARGRRARRGRIRPLSRSPPSTRASKGSSRCSAPRSGWPPPPTASSGRVPGAPTTSPLPVPQVAVPAKPAEPAARARCRTTSSCRTGGDHCQLHRRPPRAGRARAQAPRPSGRRDADRPAHARRLHRIAGIAS